MIGCIDADNTASLALHQKFGFSRVGYLPGRLSLRSLGRQRHGAAVTWARYHHVAAAFDAMTPVLPDDPPRCSPPA
jgi:hypothetical protein